MIGACALQPQCQGYAVLVSHRGREDGAKDGMPTAISEFRLRSLKGGLHGFNCMYYEVMRDPGVCIVGM